MEEGPELGVPPSCHEANEMHREEETTSAERGESESTLDLELVRSIRSGSIEAWHRFVDQYSNLILSIVSRYLPRESKDDRRTLYVGILEVLLYRRLAQYDGRSSLAAWVAVVSRSLCLDEIRHRYGRKQIPEWIGELSPAHREVYRLHFLEGESVEAICVRLSKNGATAAEEAWTRADVERALERIDAHLDPGMRSRLAYDLYARDMGAPSGRLLALVDHLLQEARERVHNDGVQSTFEERETEERLLKLREFLSQLPKKESEALRLRFSENKTAKEIAGNLGLPGQRSAYTVLDRALRHLNEMFRGVGTVKQSQPRRGEGSTK